MVSLWEEKGEGEEEGEMKKKRIRKRKAQSWILVQSVCLVSNLDFLLDRSVTKQLGHFFFVLLCFFFLLALFNLINLTSCFCQRLPIFQNF